jgi:hypothetical protein
MFRPVLHTVQLVHKWHSPNSWCKPSSVCGWYQSLWDRTQGRLCSQKTLAVLNSMTAWCKQWYIKINEEKIRVIYFSHRIRSPKSLLRLNGHNISFVNSIKYLGVIFDKNITWKLHIEMVTTKAYRTYMRLYSLFKSARLSTNSKLTSHKALIRFMTYACPAWAFAAYTRLMKPQSLQNKVLRISTNFQGTPRFVICIYPFQFHTIRCYNQIMQAASQSH